MDITKASYDIKLDSIEHATKQGLILHNPFDLFFFDDQRDYDCFIESQITFVQHNVTKLCSFTDRKHASVHSQILDYNVTKTTFINYLKH